MSLQIPKLHLLSMMTFNDKAIMDVAINLSSFSSKELIQINLVRINLEVFFLSDLVRQNTNRITDYYIKGWKDKWSKSSYSWPKVYPSPAVFQT